MKYLDIKGCTVISNRGKILGIIEDLIYNRKTNRVCSIIIELHKTIVNHFFIIKLSDMEIENNKIIVKNKLYPINNGIVNTYRSLFFNELIDKPIIIGDENEVGALKDIIFDESNGDIKAIICSRGVLEDMVDGRRVILVDKETDFNNEKIYSKSDDISIYNDMSLWKHTEE